MKSFTCVIHDPLGIHARPAGKLSKVAKSFPESTILIKKNDSVVAASQLMKLMGLGVKQNDQVTVTIEGGDEDAVFDEVRTFFGDNFSAEFI